MSMASTVTLPATPAIAGKTAQLPLWQRIAAAGSGFGIAVSGADLHAAIVRSRPGGATLVAETTVKAFRSRPAAEWGAELNQFLTAAGEGRMAATLLLPRSEVIVRTLLLPGVSDKDATSAIELQIDTLHPFGDEEVAWGWARAGRESVVTGVVRKPVLDGYEILLNEAGIPLAAVTFTPTVLHAALRIWNAAPEALLCVVSTEAGRTELYGESPARGVYSAEFAIPATRALSVARSELRLPADFPVTGLEGLLQTTGRKPASDLAYLAALAGASARTARFANLLPEARRASHDRMRYLLPAALGVLLVAAVVIWFAVLPAIAAHRYRSDLDQAARRLEPAANRAKSLERAAAAARAKTAVLDEFRGRPQLDLDSLNELTRLLPPPVWTSAIEIYPDSIVITGEADNAAPLLKALDSSPLFQNSEFVSSVVRTQQGEQFRIKTMRRGRAGRTTP